MPNKIIRELGEPIVSTSANISGGKNPRAKKVYQCTLAGNVLQLFDSLSVAGRITGVHADSISSVVTGNTQTAGGYKWKYA